MISSANISLMQKINLKTDESSDRNNKSQFQFFEPSEVAKSYVDCYFAVNSKKERQNTEYVLLNVKAICCIEIETVAALCNCICTDSAPYMQGQETIGSLCVRKKN